MRKHMFKFLAPLLLLACIGTVDADMVILKSGEIFQTPRAWKEGPVVNYYQDGQVVQVDESEVERLVHSRAPFGEPPPRGQQSVADSPHSTSPPAAGQGLASPLFAGKDTGYLGLKWGQPLSTFNDLEPAGTDPAYGGVQQYTPKKEPKRFGRVHVDDIIYGFWQGGLYTIVVWTSNFLDFGELKAEAFRRYGRGIQNRDSVEKYYWTDEGTDRMLSYSYETNAGYLWLRSRAVHETIRRRYPD